MSTTVLVILALALGCALFFIFNFGIAPALIFSVGLMILVDTAWQYRGEQALRAYGQSAEVTMVGDTYQQITRRRSGAKTFKGTVTFTTAKGEVIVETVNIPEKALSDFVRTRRSTVTYLPSKPKLFGFSPIPPYSNSPFLISFGLVLLGAVWGGIKKAMDRE